MPNKTLQAAVPTLLASLYNRNLSLVPNICGVHTILETSDAKVVLNQRSSWVHYHSMSWSASLEEGLETVDVESGDATFHRAGARGVSEALLPGQMIRAEDFVLLGVIAEHEIVTRLS